MPLLKLLTWYRQVKMVDCQHGYAAAFAPMLNAFEDLEWTKEVIES